jgi:hypothetical protein
MVEAPAACEEVVDGLQLPDDRFIPVRHEDLVAAIETDPQRFGAAHRQIARVAEAVARVIDQETTAFRRDLDCRYAVFNPDRETVAPEDLTNARCPEGYDAFRARLHYLLDKANFERLDHVQIESAVQAANSQGLRIRVRPERVDHLDLYVRGRAYTSRAFKTWRRPIKGVPRELDLYRRLAVVVQLKESPYVALKLFRDIPAADIEALLPHAEVRMTPFDRVKLIGGGAGALSGVATKLFWMLVGGAVVASQLMWLAVVALFGLSLKSLLGSRRAMAAGDFQRTRHLYDRNLSNNAGVLHHLLTLVAHEELKEAVLAYAFLASGDGAITKATELDGRVERWLCDRFHVEVNYDCPDALETLERFGLWADRERWRVAEPSDAIARLEAHWSARRTADYHLSAAGGTS